MNGLGADFLAGAALAGDEHRGAAAGNGGDLAIDLLHGVRTADEGARARFRLGGGTGGGGGGLGYLPGFQRAGDDGYQPGPGEGLDEKIKGTQPHGFNRACQRGVGGSDNHRQATKQFGIVAQQPQPVDIGQLQVEQHGREFALAGQRAQGLFAGIHRHRLKARPLQLRGIGDSQRRQVFHDQNAFAAHMGTIVLTGWQK